MDLFQTLSDPTRREIIELLVVRERTVGEIAERFPISRPAVAKHLAALEEAGLLLTERRGREKWCRVEPAPLVSVTAWVEEVLRGHGPGPPVSGAEEPAPPAAQGRAAGRSTTRREPAPWKVW